MNRSFAFFVLMASVLIAQAVRWPSETIAQEHNPQKTALEGLRAETVEALVRDAFDEHGIPGLSIAVAVDNKITFARGFGSSDVENDVPTTEKTKFRTASIAKSMTAVAIMSLVEGGKLDLDAKVQEYCPDYPKKRWPVTSRQLLGHLGGVRHYKSAAEARSTQHYFTLKSALDAFKDDPGAFLNCRRGEQES